MGDPFRLQPCHFFTEREETARPFLHWKRRRREKKEKRREEEKKREKRTGGGEELQE